MQFDVLREMLICSQIIWYNRIANDNDMNEHDACSCENNSDLKAKQKQTKTNHE